MRQTDPSTYLRVVASLLPKDVTLSVQQHSPGDSLDPESWGKLRRLLDLIESACPEGTDEGAVLEEIEHALRSRFARQIE